MRRPRNEPAIGSAYLVRETHGISGIGPKGGSVIGREGVRVFFNLYLSGTLSFMSGANRITKRRVVSLDQKAVSPRNCLWLNP